MGVDTKGCVVTTDKNAFKVAKTVCDKIRSLMEEETGVKGFRINQLDDFRLPKVHMSEWCEMLSISFLFKGEQRDLRITFDCDCDLKIYEEIDGDSCLWFTLGYWGSSEQLMREVLQSMKEFGKVYIDVNDCDDVGFDEV